MIETRIAHRGAGDPVHRSEILIVDHDPRAIPVLHNVLRGPGQCLFATLGHEALEILRASAADQVLLDAALYAAEAAGRDRVIGAGQGLVAQFALSERPSAREMTVDPTNHLSESAL